MSPSEFIYRLLSLHQVEGRGFIELWWKNHRTDEKGSKWVEWPAEVGDIEEALDELGPEVDKYFTPAIFLGKKRDSRKAHDSRLVWLDVDNGDVSEYVPTVSVRTSPESLQCYWLLSEKLPIREIEKIGKRLGRRVGADPQSAYICKPFRIPGYRNGKVEYRESPPLVRVDHFGSKVIDLPRKDETIDLGPGIPKSVAAVWSRPKNDDRSGSAYSVYNHLHGAGFSQEQMIAVCRHIPWIRDRYKGTLLAKDISRFFEKESIPVKTGKNKKVIDHSEVTPAELMFGNNGYINRNAQEKAWLVEGWLRRGSWHVLSGNPKSYKSAIAHALALAVATGTPAFGVAQARQGPAMLVDWENTPTTYRTTVVKLAEGVVPDRVYAKRKGSRVVVELGSDIPMYVMNRSLYLDDEESQDYLLAEIDRIAPALVVVDTLTSCAPGVDINDIRELQELTSFFEKICMGGAALLVLHHNRKGSVKDASTRGHMMAGSHKLFGWAEGLIQVERPDDTDYVDVHFNGRFEHGKALRLSVPEDTEKDAYNRFKCETITEIEEREEREKAEKEGKLERIILRILGSHGACGTFKLLSVMKKEGQNLSRRVLEKTLKMMIETGEIDEVRGPKGKEYASV